MVRLYRINKLQYDSRIRVTNYSVSNLDYILGTSFRFFKGMGRLLNLSKHYVLFMHPRPPGRHIAIDS